MCTRNVKHTYINHDGCFPIHNLRYTKIDNYNNLVKHCKRKNLFYIVEGETVNR